MSYILEALKKSDKERQREEIPDLQADHSLPSVQRQEPRGPGLYLLGALALGSVAALVWWQFPGDQVPQLVDNSKVVPVPVAVVHAPEVLEMENPEQTTAMPTVVKEGKAVEGVLSGVAAPEVTAPELAGPEIRSTGARTSGVSAEAAEVVREPVIQGEIVIPLLDELPSHVKTEVPDLSFAGHVYGDDARKRLIIINNRIVREGDMVSNELFLEQIRPDGVVLRHKTVVFRVQLF